MSKRIASFVLLVLIALVLHHRQRKNENIGLAAYGRELLGIHGQKPGRKQYLDFLRFLAVVLVIVVHTMNPAGVELMEAEEAMLAAPALPTQAELNLLWLLRNIVKGIAAMALSCNLLFIMISGALLLPCREEPPGEFYLKRFSRVLIPLVGYYLYYLLISDSLFFYPASIWEAVKTIISGPNGYVPHFWMAYLLLGLYIAVPFQRRMLKDLPESLIKGMALMVLGGSAVKVLLIFAGCGLPSNAISYAPSLFGWEGIFFWGYFLTLPCCRKYDKYLLIGGGISAVIIACLFCGWANAAAVAANYSPFTILTASGIFVLFMRREEKRRGKKGHPVLNAVVQVGNKYSFSILLIHWFVLFIVVEQKMGLHCLVFGTYGVFAAVMLQVVVTLGVSFGFALVFDQTVLFVMQKGWDGVVEGIRRMMGKGR